MLALFVPMLAFQATVFVDAGTLTSSLSAELTAELKDIATTTLAAVPSDLRVAIVPHAAQLEFRVTNAEGASLVERELSLEDGPRPALRIAVLLVAEAVGTLPQKRAVVPQERATHWTLIAGAGGEWWSAPVFVLPAFYFGAEVSVGPIDLGAALIASGFGCCTLAVADAIQGAPLLLGGRVQAALPFFESGLVRVAGTAALTIAWRNIDGLVLAFAGPAVNESHSSAEVAARGGFALDLVPGPLGFRLAAGVEVRAARLTIRVPDGYPSAGEPLDPGVVGPWLELGVRWRLN